MTEFNNKSPHEIALAQLKVAMRQINQKHTNSHEARTKFLNQYGSLTAFMTAQGRVVDLTDLIRNEQDVENTQSPLLLSFFALSEKLFPVEGERETRRGFQLYVQPDKNSKFPPNERRILAVVENEQVIGAAVYGVCLYPASAADTGIDGVAGITYAMVDPEYQGVGLGKSMVELVQDKATEFVSSQRVDDPKIVMGAEINEWRKMALEDLGSVDI